MSEYLPFIFNGLVTGAVYGLAATGLVLTYKISGVFNFAQGALATISAYVFYTLHVQHGLNWPLAAVISIGVVGPIVGVLLERLARSVAGRALALQVGATVGVLLIVEAAVVLIYGDVATREVPVFLGTAETTLFGSAIQVWSIITFVVAIVVTAGLYLYFRFARMGVAMRAVVDNSDLVDLTGQSAVSVRRYGWIIGSLFACLCGVLFSTLLPLDPVVLTLLVVQAFGAAALGGFRNLPVTFLGGLFIGLLASLSTKWFTTGILANFSSASPFIVLFVVLLVFPRRFLTASSRVVSLRSSSWTAPWQVQTGGAVLVLAALATVPAWGGIHVADWSNALAITVLFLSLGLLVRTSGQVSLGQVAFMAVGASAFSHFATGSLHLPWLVAVIGSGLICIPIGALLAIPAIRLTGLYLALATFGFAVLLSYMFYTQSFMFGDSGAALSMPRPSFATGDNSFYYVVLAFLVIATLAVTFLERGRLGRLLRGLDGSSAALRTLGTNVNVTRVLVFCISAALAGLAGAFSGMSQSAVSASNFPPLLSLTDLALVLIVFGGTPWYALMAGLALTLIPAYESSSSSANWLQLAFGLAAVVYTLTPSSRMPTVPVRIRVALDARFRAGRASEAFADAEAAVAHLSPLDPATAAADLTLAAGHVTVRFGGVTALDDVSVSAPRGRITGLIGPNGAGKTTMFNTISGLSSAAHADVQLGQQSLRGKGAPFRARAGLGRTFQQMQLFESMTVGENVAIGREGALAGGAPYRHLLSGPRERREIARACGTALGVCGLAGLADRKVSELSTGQRRLVELARSVASDSKILLLDEPSSGLDHRETDSFGQILREVVGQRQVGILLVEHDMSLVMDLCEYIYVLDFGKLIFAGTPEEVRASHVVQTAYLGGSDDDQLVDLSTVGEGTQA